MAGLQRVALSDRWEIETWRFGNVAVWVHELYRCHRRIQCVTYWYHIDIFLKIHFLRVNCLWIYTIYIDNFACNKSIYTSNLSNCSLYFHSLSFCRRHELYRYDIFNHCRYIIYKNYYMICAFNWSFEVRSVQLTYSVSRIFKWFYLSWC